MTNNLPAQYAEMSDSEIMALTGQQTNDNSPRLPQLRTNKLDRDDEGNEIPIGSYNIYVKDIVEDGKGAVVYAREANFRVFQQVMQYVKYDPIEGKYAGNSVMFKSWRSEILDDMGTLKCGKVTKKQLEYLPADEQLEQKQIKCKRIWFGTVSMNGVTGEGKEVTVTDYPCMWKTGGSNWNPLDNIMELINKQNRPCLHYSIDLGLQREQKGSNVYFVSVPTVDISKTVPFTPENGELLGMFAEYVETNNKDIRDKYWAAHKAIPVPADSLADDFIDVTPESLNDDVPF